MIAGSLPLLFLPELLSDKEWWSISVLVCLLSRLKLKAAYWIACFLTVFLWATSYAQGLLQQATEYNGERQDMVGKVETIALGQTEWRRVLFTVSEMEGKKIPSFHIILTGWESELPPQAGQIWQINAQIRPIHARLNEGGFDRQRWGVTNHLVLTGKVTRAELVNPEPSWRQSYIRYVQVKMPQLEYPDILLALAFGERALISPERTKLLQLTCTAHLMAISGLHISLVALFGWGIGRLLQLVFPLSKITPYFPLCIGTLVAIFYVWLSGMSPPALRAGVALLLWFYFRTQSRLYNNAEILLKIMAILLVSDPLMVLSESFWLSCFAVSALIYWYRWVPLPDRFTQRWCWCWLRWLHLEVGMLILLLPMQLFLFHGLNVLSVPANLWAVPIVSFVTLPILLCALLLSGVPSVATSLWQLADMTLAWTFYPLGFFSQGWLWIDQGWLMTGLLGWIGVFFYRTQTWLDSPFSILALFSLAIIPSGETSQERWRLTMLDVGHGLAMVLESRGKALLYDTAARWESGSIAEYDILPFLRWRGLELEHIVVSHQHQDHAGGLQAVLKAYPNSQLLTSSSLLPGEKCVSGRNWDWQGLRIEVLWPIEVTEHAENAHSCTLLISDGRFKVLLTGDLEKAQEHEIVRKYRRRGEVDIMQIPHHGSKTSSSSLFLRTLQPKLAIASVARFNPWRLPATSVIKRYQLQGIDWQDTAHNGQISLLFFADEWQILTYRSQLNPRWYHQWFGSSGHNG